MMIRLTPFRTSVRKRIAILLWADVLAGCALWMLMTYLTDVWKIKFTHAAAIVNIYGGVTSILPVGLSYLLDTIVGLYYMLLFSSISYSIGLGFLWMSTPPVLSNATGTCSTYEPNCIGDAQTILFYMALALTAMGRAGHVISLVRFIYVQELEHRWRWESGVKNDVLNYVLSVTSKLVLVVAVLFPFIKPWSLRFGIPAICTVVATLVFVSWSPSYEHDEPVGSNLTHVFRVIVATILKINMRVPDDHNQLYEKRDRGDNLMSHTDRLRWLDKASIVKSSEPLEKQERNRWSLCTVSEVEETKIALRLIPMGMTFVAIGLVSSIGTTFFLEQANSMNPKVGKLSIPAPVLLAFYEIAKIPAEVFYVVMASSLSQTKRKYVPGFGIAIGMFLSILCCITAAKVEERRIDVVNRHSLLDKPGHRAPMSMFWLIPQFYLLASLDALARRSVACFFIFQVPSSMRSYMVYFTEAVFGGGIIGGVLSVFIAGKVSEQGGKQSWFGDTLNKSRLDNYYWTLAALSAINLILYALISISYECREMDISEESEEDDGTLELLANSGFYL